MTADDDFLSRAELDELAQALAKIDLDLELEAAVMLTEPMHGTGAGIRRPQPGSRPPFNLGLEHVLDQLSDALDAAIADMVALRGLTPPPKGGTLTARAGWIHQYRYALAMIEPGRRHHKQLCRWCDRLDRAVRHPEPAYVVDRGKHQAALASVMTAEQFERTAHKLGEQAKGINARRVKYLRERGCLDGSQDAETGTWFYRVGDILAAHSANTRHTSQP